MEGEAAINRHLFTCTTCLKSLWVGCSLHNVHSFKNSRMDLRSWRVKLFKESLPPHTRHHLLLVFYSWCEVNFYPWSLPHASLSTEGMRKNWRQISMCWISLCIFNSASHPSKWTTQSVWKRMGLRILIEKPFFKQRLSACMKIGFGLSEK